MNEWMLCGHILHKWGQGHESYKVPDMSNYEKETNPPAFPLPNLCPPLESTGLLNGWTLQLQSGLFICCGLGRHSTHSHWKEGGAGWSAFISGSPGQVGTNQEKGLAIKCSIESFKYHLMCHKFGLAVENQSSPYANERWNEILLVSHCCPPAHQSFQFYLTGLNFFSILLHCVAWSPLSPRPFAVGEFCWWRQPSEDFCWCLLALFPHLPLVDSAATGIEPGWAGLSPETLDPKLMSVLVMMYVVHVYVCLCM